MRVAAIPLLSIPFLMLSSAAAEEPEQLEQKTLSIRGNQALPGTLYIAPWKRLGAPLDGTPFESGLDDKPEPLERELFRKQLELIQEGYSVDRVP